MDGSFDGSFDGDVDGLTGAELSGRLVSLERDRNLLDATRVQVVARWDGLQGWATDGALSGVAWLRCRFGCSASAAQLLLRVARRLRSMPLTTAAFLAGGLSLEKVDLLASCCTKTTAELFVRDEGQLVEWARMFATDQFRLVVRRWRAYADPDGHEKSARELVEGRKAHWSELTWNGLIAMIPSCGSGIGPPGRTCDSTDALRAGDPAKPPDFGADAVSRRRRARRPALGRSPRRPGR